MGGGDVRPMTGGDLVAELRRVDVNVTMPSAQAQPLSEVPLLTAPTCRGASCWKTTGSTTTPTGYKYNDKNAGGANVRRASLKAGEQSFASLRFKLKGPQAANFALPLSPTVWVQLVVIDDGGASRCWQTPFSELLSATDSKLKAKGP